MLVVHFHMLINEFLVMTLNRTIQGQINVYFLPGLFFDVCFQDDSQGCLLEAFFSRSV